MRCPKCETEKEIFEFVYDGIQKGAVGLNLGRNILQHDYPVTMIRAIRAIIHEDVNVKEALEVFERGKGRRG